MTLKQEQMLETMVTLLGSVMRQHASWGDPVPFFSIASVGKPLHVPAMSKLVEAGLLKRKMLKNFCGPGERPGYVPTAAGRRWHKEQSAILRSIIKR